MTASTTVRVPTLWQGRERGIFSALDIQFALRLGALFGEEAPELLWALALACRQEAQGHVCADLPKLDARGLVLDVGPDGASDAIRALPAGIDLDEWLAKLRGSRLIGKPATPTDERPATHAAHAAHAAERPGRADSAGSAQGAPLILDDRGRLYLRRSHVDQSGLAAEILRRGAAADLEVDWSLAEAGITRLAPPRATASTEAGGATPNRSHEALRVGLARPLSIVTGGPGTGKTTLVAGLIALVIEQALARGGSAPIVRLLAPTGKAAAAMTASFQAQREVLDVPDAVRAALPTSAETVHRVLLRQSRRDGFGRAQVDPLEADIVVVDEVSMVDLAQMRRLFAVCRDVERLTLLGDPDQLASVDAGAVLAELCSVASAGSDRVPDFAARATAPAAGGPRLVDSMVTLRESHRFASGGAIGRLAEAIREGDAEAVLGLLADPEHPEVELAPADSVAVVRGRLIASVREMQRAIEAADSLEEKLARLATRRVLCAHRRGLLGVDALCEVLDDAAAESRDADSRSGWWRGRLLLVTRNAPEQDLWNGDVGLVEETPQGLRALFPDAAGRVRSMSAGRLPAHESAIAMSVHKSQGSEFEVVDLVLGPTSSRLMTRELLYTGVTRARQRICIHASEAAIRDALARRVERDSALAEILIGSEA
jgi:exodeoxyribonuclease V alpha subunit